MTGIILAEGALDSTRIYKHLIKNGWSFTNNNLIADSR